MSRVRVLSFVAAMCAVVSACGSDGVTSPSASGYTGEWSGTTSQGARIAFSVSSDQTVTSIAVGYSFNGCSGSNTLSNLSLPIGQSPFPPRVPTPGNAVFGYGSGSPEAVDYTQVQGTFTSNQMSAGSLTFLNFSNCGNTVASWNATKR